MFEELGCHVEAWEPGCCEAVRESYEVLAYQRVAAEVEPALGRGLDAGLDAKYRWYRGLTGEDIMAACGQLKSATERARKSRAEITAEAGLGGA